MLYKEKMFIFLYWIICRWRFVYGFNKIHQIAIVIAEGIW
jgi:hypothetical protein